MIYDITKELFSAEVYPGDPEPKYSEVNNMKQGDEYNMTYIAMCPHNATHADAPKHFIDNGKTIDQVDLDRFIGRCRVIEHEGDVTLAFARECVETGYDRILIKGRIRMTKEGARALAEGGVRLVGVEGKSVGGGKDNTAIHRILLKREVAVLESLDMSGVEPGEYFLSALPLKMAGIEASPVRAVLIRE